MKIKTRITETDYIVAQRRARRIIEIEMFGKQISNRSVVHSTHKMYNRQDNKKIVLD